MAFGPNGAGKSTLVKIIMEEEEPTSGKIRIGENINIGYYSQVAKKLNKDKNLFETFLNSYRCI